jgi:hypothetical protein
VDGDDRGPLPSTGIATTLGTAEVLLAPSEVDATTA